MRHTITLNLLVLLIIPATLWAEDQLTAIPQPAPRISESTLITGTGWSGRGNRNESLACDLAEARAIQQVRRGVALAREKGLITTQELSRALPLTRYRNWDPGAGRCTIRLELEVRVLPKTGVPIMLERQF